MSRRLSAAALACIAALCTLPGSATAKAPSLSATAGSAFPERSFVLTLPERARLVRGELRVTENGRPVHALRAAPSGAARSSKLGVVLAIDASSSMRGGPLAAALSAARAFAHERSVRQPLGLVTFNSSPRVALPLTEDPWEIRAALRRNPGAGGHTAIYDAGARAVEMLRAYHLPGGFVVVLSDGSDTGSRKSAGELARLARAAHVRIYTVGLRSRHFDGAALRRLAGATGGAYSEAGSPGALGRIYSALGSELSNSYLLHYRSLAEPKEHVTVRATVSRTGSATASYTAPPLRLDGKPALEPGAWSSPKAIALAAVLFACFVAAVLWMLLTLRRPTVRDRVSRFVTAPSEEPKGGLGERIRARVERSLATSRWWTKLAEDADIAGVATPPAQLVLLTAAGAFGLAFFAAIATGSRLLALAVMAGTPVAVRVLIKEQAERARRRFADQLADHLAVVAGAMRAGHGFSTSLAAVLDDAPQPTRREFQRAVTDERLGSPLEEALERVATRMANRDVEQLAMLAVLQREAGADAAEMLDRIVDSIRERQELRRQVRTLTAQGRMSRWILTALPIVVLAFLSITNSRFMAPLISTRSGHVVLAITALMVISGSLVIKRIIDIKV